MNNQVRQKLHEIISSYGVSLLDDPRRLEGMLRDWCPESQLEIFSLVSAMQKKVPADLLAGSRNSDPTIVARLSKRLEDNLGFKEELAQWVVESWMEALGITNPASPISSQLPLPGPPLPSPIPSPKKTRARNKTVTSLFGVFIIVFGSVLLLKNLRFVDLSWERHWPVLVWFPGIYCIIRYKASRDKKLLIPIIGLFGVSTFLFMFTTGAFLWLDMASWWPMIFIILGFGFLATYLADVRDWKWFGFSGGILIVGMVFLAENNPLTKGYLKYWPVFLVVLGLVYVIQSFRRGKSN